MIGKQHIEYGNEIKAVKLLGIDRTRLYSKIGKYDIQ